jgi:transposase
MEVSPIQCYSWGMRPFGTPQELERRRRRAVQLLEAGETITSVAHTVGSSLSSVMRWQESYQRKGAKGLRPSPTPGRPPKLSQKQCTRLLQMLQRGPRAAGYSTELWTLSRVADVIAHKFDVQYHPCHVWRILDNLGWSCQKPERRARERNEEEIDNWRQYRWAHIKKRQTGKS